MRDAVRLLSRHVPSARSRIAWAGLLAVVAGILEAAALVITVKVAIAVISDSGDVQLPIGLGATGQRELLSLVAACLAGLIGAHVILARIQAKLTAEILHAARFNLVAAFLDARWERQSAEPEGSIQDRVAVLAQQLAVLADFTLQLITGRLNIAVLVLAAIIVDPVVTAFIVVLGAALVALIRPMVRATRRRATVNTDEGIRVAERTARISTTMMEVRAFGVQEHVLSEFEVDNRRAADAFRRMRAASRTSATVYRDLAIAFLVAAVAMAGLVDGLNVGNAGSVMLLIVRGLNYATSMQNAQHMIAEAMPSAIRFNSLVDDLQDARAHPGTTRLESIEQLELADVAYSYDRKTDVLTGVDLQVLRGEIIGIVGTSGAGKSTLLEVLLGLRSPTTGRYTANGFDVATIDPLDWTRLVAYVPQDARLFQGTVEENIRFYRPEITAEQIRRAAQQANISHEIEALADGYATVLGPRGTGVSGGQAQRIAIARALAGTPSILVLDEPTSSLDTTSERAVTASLEALRGVVTVIMVTHRADTVGVCDRALRLKNGRLTAVDDESTTSVEGSSHA